MGAPRVTVVGAGLAGLATGIYAQMNGFDSRIFEHHSVAGGVAATWKRGDYVVDGGIHFLMGWRSGTSVYDLYVELGALDGVQLVPLTTYGRYVDASADLDLTLDADLGRFREAVAARSPADAPLVDELLAGAIAMRGLDLGSMGLDRPPELTGSLDRVRQIWRMRRAARYFKGRHARPLAEWADDFADPALARMMARLFLPEVPAWFLESLLALLADGQLGLFAGGCREFVQALERRYLELGGRIHFRSTVDEVVVRDGAARGVRVRGGDLHEADAVVSAADGYDTVYHMLDGRFVDPATARRFAEWPLISPMVVVSLGVERTFAAEPAFVTVVPEEPLTLGAETVDTLVLRFLNYGVGFAPPGHTLVQVEFESRWDHWAGLRSRHAAAYADEKRRVADEVLSRLEPLYPGLRAQVRMTDVATPYTTWRYTLNREGAYEGWLPTPTALLTPVKRTLPGVGRFYLAGQWVMPGGGVPPCLFSGRHAVQLLCRDFGRPFRHSPG